MTRSRRRWLKPAAERGNAMAQYLLAALYRKGEGVPPGVTAYMTANTSCGETAFRFAEEGRLAAFYWIESPLGYALAGALERAALIAMAKSV